MRTLSIKICLSSQSNVKPKKQPVTQKKEDLLKNDEIEKNSLLLTLESLQSQVSYHNYYSRHYYLKFKLCGLSNAISLPFITAINSDILVVAARR